MTREELAWHNQAKRYADVVLLGGTPEQRKWAWARASAALDRYIEQRTREARDRAKRDTIELDAA